MWDKAPPSDRGLYARIARERAGLVEPPRHRRDMSAHERAVRLYTGLGEQMQDTLAKSLGPERAYELRAASGGWPWKRSQYSGCGR